MKSRYFKQGNFLECSVGYRPSYAWRSIMHGRELLSQGLLKRIGNGKDMHVWYDNWILMPIPRSPRYRTDEVDLTLKVSDLIDERHGTWDVQRVRHLFVGEDANQILEMRPQLNRHDTMVWGFSRNGLYDSQNGYKLLHLLQIVENPLSAPSLPPIEKRLCRRSYSMVASQLEAELLSFMWVAESLSTLRHKNVVFESSSYLAGEAVLNPDNFPMFHGLIDVIREKLSRLQLCSIAYVQSGANQCAEAIARSVTRDQRYASYVGKDGPSWLLPMIHANAVRADNGY
uniref:RNase H type-1 domain-containing protein n=1 Tax=Brassica oleracea TaxID=3712 RepID=A0A3P6DYI1_BRAOL|nr:unnamed protein product [Brassica oleracea]